MAGRTRGGMTAAALAALVLAAGCVASEPPGAGGDDMTAADPGPEAGRDVAGDRGPEAGTDVPAPDVATDARPDVAADVTTDGGGDPGGDLPADAVADVAADPGPPPGVQCWPGEVVFPEFDRACGWHPDCALAVHQSDCCGSIEVKGIRADRLGDFQAAEDACLAQWPACGCAGRIPVADDGSTSGDLADFVVTCESGRCESRALAGCGDLERRVGEALLAVDACDAGTPCAMHELGPVCGSLSCRQVAVAQDASKEGLAALDALGGEGMSTGCQDYDCGCGYRGVPACVDGHCRLLDPGDTCEAVQQRMDALLADPATRACGTDGDCRGTTVAFAPFCTAECACAIVTNQAAAAGVSALSSQWQQLACPLELCACTKCATIVRCVDGRCQGRL